eukprot:258717-Rhodomonas_salina.1
MVPGFRSSVRYVSTGQGVAMIAHPDIMINISRRQIDMNQIQGTGYLAARCCYQQLLPAQAPDRSGSTIHYVITGHGVALRRQIPCAYRVLRRACVGRYAM